jgi:hypothetical protein
MSLTHPVARRGFSEASAHRSNNGDGTTGPSAPAEAGAAPSLRAVHTPNFPGLLLRLGASLLVTTYQAGKLVTVRDEGDRVTTHFRGFQAPLGLALEGGRLAVGWTVWPGRSRVVRAAAKRRSPA